MANRAKLKKREKSSPAFERMLAAQKRLASGLYVKVGFLDDGSRHPDSDITIAGVAAVHEYGYPEGKIPARPFVGPSFEANRSKYERATEKLLRRYSSGTLELDAALGVLGLMIATDMRAYVVGGTPIAPENSDAVIARKLAKSSGAEGGVRSLVDTGRMMNSITWVVISERPPSAQ